MPSYRVIWEIDIIADYPGKAAEEALRMQKDPNSIATFFTVYDLDPTTDLEHGPWNVDLIEQNCEICRCNPRETSSGHFKGCPKEGE